MHQNIEHVSHFCSVCEFELTLVGCRGIHQLLRRDFCGTSVKEDVTYCMFQKEKCRKLSLMEQEILQI